MSIRFLKKKVALFLVACLLLQLVPVAVAASESVPHWAQDNLDKVINMGWLPASLLTPVDPARHVTRAEFIHMVNGLMGFTEPGDISRFTDVSPGDWYYETFSIAVNAGYVNGTAADRLSPNALITREQAFVIFVRVTEPASIRSMIDCYGELDWDDISHWAFSEVTLAIENGFVSGMDGRINPQGYLTLGQSATLLLNQYNDVRTFAFGGHHILGYEDTIDVNSVRLQDSGFSILVPEWVTVGNIHIYASVQFAHIDVLGHVGRMIVDADGVGVFGNPPERILIAPGITVHINDVVYTNDCDEHYMVWEASASDVTHFSSQAQGVVNARNPVFPTSSLPSGGGGARPPSDPDPSPDENDNDDTNDSNDDNDSNDNDNDTPIILPIPPYPPIPHTAAATTMMQEWLDVYLFDMPGIYYSIYKWSDRSAYGGSSPGETGFWLGALVYELLNDAYEHTLDPRYKAYMDGFRSRFLRGDFSWSNSWYRNRFVDDILWWSSAFLRTYTISGDESYLALAAEMFDIIHTYGWDTRPTCTYTGVPGGLMWMWNINTPHTIQDSFYGTQNEKNIATNGNGAMVAARLSRAYGARGDLALRDHYADIAEKIYHWMFETMLLDTTTGRLTDNYLPSGYRRDWQFAYNYGLFASAAYEIWVNTGEERYLNDALLVLRYGWSSLTIEDNLTLRDEGGMDGGDSAGFRIVLIRQTGQMARRPEFAEFRRYLQANAYQAYHNRRVSDGFIGSNLAATPRDNVRIPSVIAGMGVALQWFSGFDPSVTYGFEGGLHRIPAWGQNGIYIAEQATRQNINFTHQHAGDSVGITHTVFWDYGGQNNNIAGTSRFLEFDITVETSGYHELAFRWFTRGNNTRRVSVNGGASTVLDFTRTATNVWEHATMYAHLNAGVNTVRVWFNQGDAGTDGWLFLDYMRVSGPVSSPGQGNVFLVSDAIRSNVEYVQQGNGNFRNNGRSPGHTVWWDAGGNGSVTFTAYVDTAGFYQMSFGWFARGNDNVVRTLSINGGASVPVTFTDGGYRWVTTMFHGSLVAGANTITLSFSPGQDTWLLLDHLRVDGLFVPPADGRYLAESAMRARVNFGFQTMPGSVGATHSVFWDGYGGDGYLTFNVLVGSAGLYDLSFRWFARINDNVAPDSLNNWRYLDVNGVRELLAFEGQVYGAWEYVTITRQLYAGLNTIVIQHSNANQNAPNNWNGWLMLDYVQVLPSVSGVASPFVTRVDDIAHDSANPELPCYELYCEYGDDCVLVQEICNDYHDSDSGYSYDTDGTTPEAGLSKCENYDTKKEEDMKVKDKA